MTRIDNHRNKMPALVPKSGHFVLATSYSRTAYRRTTIGAAAFHCRVRNGNGWCHCATITRVRNRTGGFAAFAATQARGRISGDDVDLAIDNSFQKNIWFSDIYIQEVKAQRFKASFYLDLSFPITAVPTFIGTAAYWKSKRSSRTGY